MKRKNLENIKAIFEEKTGVSLTRKARMPVRRLFLIGAAVICCLAMAAFTYPLFSPLEGDALSLQATYAGDGLVYVRVENRSDKSLRFQEQTKLMRWVTGAEVPGLGGEPVFHNTEFAPHSEGVMVIDLWNAYDVKALETATPEWYYLVLTNNEFLFGHDWICSICFESEKPQSLPETQAPAEISPEVPEELAFYFEEIYLDVLPAFNEQNFLYLQRAEEYLTRYSGELVPLLSPTIPVGGIADSKGLPMPELAEPQGWESAVQWTSLDGFGRIVGREMTDKLCVLSVLYPKESGDIRIPVLYLAAFDAEQITDTSETFVSGRILSLRELEAFRVYEDDRFVLYDVTHLFFSDPESWAQEIFEARGDILTEEELLQICQAFEYCRERENLIFVFPDMPDDRE